MKVALIEITAELMQFPSGQPVSKRVLAVREIDSMEEQDSLIAKCRGELKEGEVLAVRGGFSHHDDEFDAAERQQEADLEGGEYDRWKKQFTECVRSGKFEQNECYT